MILKAVLLRPLGLSEDRIALVATEVPRTMDSLEDLSSSEAGEGSPFGSGELTIGACTPGSLELAEHCKSAPRRSLLGPPYC